MDLKALTLSINQIAEEKGIPREKVIETMEQALAAAYKKEYGKKGQKIEAEIDPKTGETKFWQLKEVVAKDDLYSEEELEALKEKEEGPAKEEKEVEKTKIRFHPERHLLLEEAKKLNPKAKPGEILRIPLPEKEDFGRIAAQTAKQVILQKLREAERDALLAEFQEKEGGIISGVIQRVEENNVYVDLGKTVGILPKSEQIENEFYKPGQRLKFYVLRVEQDSKGPRILLSRAYPKLVSKLFELEVPEISSGQVEIKSIAREPGSRSKIALFTKEEGLDPVGSAIGQRGSRVGAVIAELGGEKIDIIEYSEKAEDFIKNALLPAKVLEVKILPKNRALALVPEDQLSLAIGRGGQNVRLAARLTNWKIDIQTPKGEKVEMEALAEKEGEEAELEGRAEEEKKAEPEAEAKAGAEGKEDKQTESRAPKKGKKTKKSSSK